jgi:hypothetical protein
MMDRDNFGWVPAPGQPGVSEKPLGVFTERRTEAGFVKLDPGASYTGTGRGIYVCYAGKGQVESEPLRPATTVFLDHGEHATFTAEEATELVHFGLPDLRDLALTPEAHAPAVAAE